uniref:Putative rRNA methyltransferase n=1 Tax=Phallusia mammillata TaxID=59560 RepID=A0A6F9DCJ2_9ASCI|nr:pre-rRNA processing protein FTSJ3-like [Phallusia mammillata]
MGKNKAKAKARKDKYYQLAKETGYRARSAFKLLQLNKKFNFLQSSQVLVDLCAAPGGWLQVASEHMPIKSIILGVDLVPIKPIPRCITFQDDITKESCRTQIKNELHNWKVDCFLHDGAPNVGKNWLHDAYSQSVLTLHSVKLACEFLKKGGWFISKVFRSKDYQALMWVFGQLFNKVHATKPQASRNVSAEIFVVCQGYKAPDKIDSKFFDPKSVFQEIEGKQRDISILDFEPKKKKKKAKGYEEERDLLFRKVSVSDFLADSNPLKLLSEVNELEFTDEALKTHKLVTKDMIENVKDIKSLGKKEIKGLLNLHRKMKKLAAGKPADVENLENDEEPDSEEEIEKKLTELKEDEARTLKKKKKTVLKERNKLRERMSHMAQSITVQDDMELFALENISAAKKPTEISDDVDVDQALQFESDQSDDEVEMDSDTENPKDAAVDEDADEESVDDFETQLWFKKDIFRKIEEDENEVDEVSHAEEYHQNKTKSAEPTADKQETGKDTPVVQEEEESDSDSDNEEEMEQRTAVAKENYQMDAEGLALGTVISTSNKRKRDVIDASFNRYTFNDDVCNLPDWFVEDEKKRVVHNHLKGHVPKDLVNFYKSKEMKINDRTIKKVAEAKARKKRKQMKKLDKARKQAEGITDSQDMSNKEKAAHVKTIYKKAGLLGKKKEHTTYVFAKKGTGKRVRRPPGVAGKFKVVDKRMKKDLRMDKKKGGKGGKRR